MPENPPNDQLEWSEENLSKVVSDIYAEAETDSSAYDKLLADPYEVLNSRIKVPDGFKGKIHAKPRGDRMMVLNVPNFRSSSATTTRELPAADYQILCTTLPPW